MIKTENTKYIIGMFVAMIFWGIAWTSGKTVTEHTNAEVAAFWRYAISFITIIPVIFYLKIPFKTDKMGLFYMILAGLLSALFNYLFFVGLSHGEAGYGGTIMTSIVPLLTYALSILFLGTKINSRQTYALMVGFLGAVILLRIPFDGIGFLNVHTIYFLLCAITWAVVTIIAQKSSTRVDPFIYTLIVFGITGLVNMIFALPYHPFDVGNLDKIFWFNIIFIGLFSGTFSMTVFFICTSKLGAHNAGVFLFIVPIGAIVSSWIVFDEKILLSTIIGCCLAFLSVILFNSKKKTVKLQTN